MLLRIVFLVLLAGLTFGAGPSVAQGESEVPDPYAALDTWMRADALNERCNLLNYFEVRTIDGQIRDAALETPEGRNSAFSVGQANFETTLEKKAQMMEAHRKQAQADVADRPCAADDEDIKMARATYVPFYFQALLAAMNAPELNSGRAGQKNAAIQLGNFAAKMYGANSQAVAQQLAAQNTADGVTPSSAWRAIRSTVFDTLWQMRLAEKKYTYQPYPGQPGYYRAKLINVDGAFFPARLGHRTHPTIRDASGAKIRINQAQGIMDSGRIIVMVGKDAANWGPNTLEAELLVQKYEGSDWWNQKNWRENTMKFRAEQMDAPSCPADFCFVFPEEATDAIRRRRSEVGAVYNYELFIGPPNLFPLNDEESTYGRDKYYPPRLLDAEDE